MVERNYHSLIEFLRWNTVTVTFEKADGTIRQMRCTLDPKLIPEPSKDPMTQKKVREINEEVAVVWDLEKEAWRSFRLDRLLGMEKYEF